MDENVRRWVEDSPYSQAIGVELEELDADHARLKLPYRDENSNPGQALHGGCAASLGIIGAQAVARANLGEDAGPFHTAGLQVNYLAAAIGEDVFADATLLRRGKSVCFVEVEVATAEGKPIAHLKVNEGLKALRDAVEEFGPTHNFTKLVPGLDGSDPGPHTGPAAQHSPVFAAPLVSCDSVASG